MIKYSDVNLRWGSSFPTNYVSFSSISPSSPAGKAYPNRKVPHSSYCCDFFFHVTPGPAVKSEIRSPKEFFYFIMS